MAGEHEITNCDLSFILAPLNRLFQQEKTDVDLHESSVSYHLQFKVP